MANDTYAANTEPPDTYAGMVLIVLSVTGIIENGCVIYLSFRSKLTRDTTLKIITHLAATDLCTAFAVGMDAVFILGNISHKISCLTVLMIVFYMIFVSQAVLLITTFDRYVAICHQKRYSNIMKQKTLYKMLAFAWIFPLPIILVEFLGFNNWKADITCSYPNLLHRFVYLTNSTIIIGIMTITSFAYIQVLMKAVEFHRRFRPALIHGVNTSTFRLKNRRRAIKNGVAMGIVTLAFIVCWLPFHVYQYQFGLRFEAQPSIIIITAGLGNLNYIINPFLYAWQKKEIRSEAVKVMKCFRNTQRGTTNALAQNIHVQNTTSKQTPQSSYNEVILSTTSTQDDFVSPGKTIKPSRPSSHLNSGKDIGHTSSTFTRGTQTSHAIIKVRPCCSPSFPRVDI